jgi:hypothetical protein
VRTKTHQQTVISTSVPTTVRLTTTFIDGFEATKVHSENWKYPSRDIAIARLTQLLIKYPEADVEELSPDDEGSYVDVDTIVVKISRDRGHR